MHACGLQIKAGVDIAQVEAGGVADAPEPVAQGAAMDVQRGG